MHFLLGFVAALLFFYLVRRWIRGARPTEKKWLYVMVVGLILGLTLLVVLTGRLHFLVALVAGIIPFLKQLPKALRVLSSLKALRALFSDAPAAQEVATALLKMRWHAERGEMDGIVRLGRWKGKRLSALSAPAVGDLYRLAKAEQLESVPLLEAYCERRWGEDWRDQVLEVGSGQADEHAQGPMSVDQAYEILNLQPGASRQDVIDAHRQLIQKLHPDRGGSTFLAMQVNQAKDILLKHLSD